MNLDERLLDLFKRGEKSQAKSLARAVLRNEPVTAVTVAETEVRIEMPQFEGVHPLTRNADGSIDIAQRGDYRYKSESINLQFSTATMSEQAYEQTIAHLTESAGGNSARDAADPGKLTTESTETTKSAKDTKGKDEQWVESSVKFLKDLL